jgi:hypothetical protein
MLTPDIAGAAGVGTTAARADHVHNVPAATPVALGAAAAEGTSANFARSDHIHPYPTAVNVGADPAGSATAARNDAYSYTDGQLAGHEAAADPHPQYLTAAEAAALKEVEVGTTAPTDPSVLLWIDEGSNYP